MNAAAVNAAAVKTVKTADPADARLTAVETLLTHLQRELAQMHEVLLAQSAELQALRDRAAKLDGRLDRLEDDPEDRDPRAEQPPHY